MEKQENEVKIISKLETIIDRDRVLAFSDSIFAFAATLLVLKIDLPAVVDSQLSTQLTPDLFLLWPQYFANIISFLIIAYYWINHHMIFSFVKKFDKVIVWMNIVFLIFLSFLPFPVDLYGSHSTVPSIIAFYSFSLALVGFFLLIIWLYAMNKKHLLIQELTPQQKDFYTAKFLIAPIIFTLAIPLSFIDPVIAQCSWLFVLLAIYLLNRFGGSEKKTLV